MTISRLFQEHFSILRARYDGALSRCCFEQLIVHSGEVKWRFSDDMQYPFIANPQFKALIPLSDAPQSFVVWRVGEKPTLLLYSPDDFWHAAPQLTEDYWTSHFDVKIVRKEQEVFEAVNRRLPTAFLGEPDSAPGDWAELHINPSSLICALDWERSYKTNYEVHCISEATKLSVRGHHAAKVAFFEGASEQEIAFAFEMGCGQGLYEQPYPSMIGINRNAAILHNTVYSKERVEARHRKSLLIDAAASFQGYASDITRSYGFCSGIFADMIEALDDGQRNLIQSFEYGRPFVCYHAAALQMVAEILVQFGVVRMNSEAAVESGVVSHFFPHGLGHMIGLQVHDVAGLQLGPDGRSVEKDPRYPFLRNYRTIEAGQVFTVEPGIYFIEFLLDILKKTDFEQYVNWGRVCELAPFGGMRIEDNVHVTNEGIVNLTRDAFDHYPN